MKRKLHNSCHTNTKNPGNNLGIFLSITGRPKLDGYTIKNSATSIPATNRKRISLYAYMTKMKSSEHQSNRDQTAMPSFGESQAIILYTCSGSCVTIKSSTKTAKSQSHALSNMVVVLTDICRQHIISTYSTRK